MTFTFSPSIVQPSEVHDVHPELGILDLAERLDDVVFRESHAASLALDCRRPRAIVAA